MLLTLFVLLAATPGFDESFRAGLLALQRNDLNAAVENLSAASRLEPKNARVWVALAQTFWKLQDSGKAEDAASKASALAANDGLALNSLAVYYTESGQTLKAADAKGRFAATAPREKAEALYFEAVQPLLQQEKFGDAVAILSKATERLTGSAQLELALGVSYYGLRRFDEAAGAFLKTIAIAPDVDQPYIFLGKFLDQVPGRAPEAMKQFVRFERANPGNALGYLLHAKALDIQSLEPQTALQLLDQALTIDARNAPAHFERGIVLDRLQRPADAAKEFEISAELDPSDSATHYRLARDYDRLGKPDAARAEREKHTKLVEAEQAAK